MFRISLPSKLSALSAMILAGGLTISPALADDASPTLQELLQKGSRQSLIANLRSVQDDVKILSDEAHGPVLRVTCYNESYVDFRAQSVTPGQAYELSFDYRWENSSTLENNPSLEAAVTYSRPIPQIEVLPAVTIVFLNEKYEPTGDPMGGYLLHGQWRNARYTFVAPKGAVQVVIKVRAGRGRNALLVANLVFRHMPEVVTPQGIKLDFRQPSPEQTGRLWNNVLITDSVRRSAEGTLQVYVPNKEVGRFPLPGPGKYQLKAIGQAMQPNSLVAVNFYTEDGKPIRGKTAGANPDKLRTGLEFTPPEETHTLQITARGVLLEEIEVIKVE